GFEDGTRPFELFEPTLRVRESAETEVASAQPLARFANQRKGRFERRAILREDERFDVATAGRTGSARAEQFGQLVEFEDVLSGAGHVKPTVYSLDDKNVAAAAGVSATYTRRPLASPQEVAWPSSTSRTRSRMGVQKPPRTAKGFPLITDLFSISQTTASSTRVPVPPLQATKASPRRISSKRRSCQVFIRTSTSIHWFVFAAKKSAVIP